MGLVTNREFSAAQRLVDAAKLLATEPVSVQLRYLQTLAEIGVENNTTVILFQWTFSRAYRSCWESPAEIFRSD